MPAGDLLVADHQIEIRGTLTGAGTPWLLAFEGVGGLGVPQAKTHDTDLAHAAGAYFGRDFGGVRILTVPYIMRGTTAATGAAFLNLNALWAPSEVDLPLHVRLAGLGHLSFVGRPRGLAEDLSQLNRGVARALATFACSSPAYTVVP